MCAFPSSFKQYFSANLHGKSAGAILLAHFLTHTTEFQPNKLSLSPSQYAIVSPLTLPHRLGFLIFLNTVLDDSQGLQPGLFF
jgi:hypothetical protein